MVMKIGKMFGRLSPNVTKSSTKVATNTTTTTTSPDPSGVRQGQITAPTNTTEVRDEAPVANNNSITDDDQTFDDTVSPSNTNESGTYATNLSQRSTDNDGEYNDDANQGVGGGDATTVFSSAVTEKGDENSKKYFHKDVVLDSLEDGMNSLVIRSMYFIPKASKEDHVVVKVEASTISARDCMMCKGQEINKSQLPFVPGFEMVGTIQTLGDEVEAAGQLRKGDRVAAVSSFGGGNSRFISIPASRLTKIPSNVKSTEAVCMLHNYIVALRALRLARKGIGGSQYTGMKILITDGFSPVGQAVIALASMEGAEVYCCADESRHSYLSRLGVKCFDKDPESWLPDATGTFDVVIDNSCYDSYNSSWFALNQKGSLICLAPVRRIDSEEINQGACGIEIAELQQQWAELKAKLMSKTHFINTDTIYDEDTAQYKQDLRYLMFLLERGDIKPKVAERVSLNDVPDAQRLMQRGRANGSVVCVPWIED